MRRTSRRAARLAVVPAAALVALAVAACTPARGPVSSDDACWPILPLRIELAGADGRFAPVMTLGADGILRDARRAEPLGRLSEAEADLGDGNAFCGADRVVKISGAPEDPRYDGADALHVGDAVIAVSAEGVVSFRAGGRDVLGERTKGKVRVVGEVARARRTAAFMVMLAIAGPPR
jgi:hypothetical protein